MSESCEKGFSIEQKKQLEQFGKLIYLPISKTIEFVGGGSARCMICEVFLPNVK
jgi:hypothetical protein